MSACPLAQEQSSRIWTVCAAPSSSRSAALPQDAGEGRGWLCKGLWSETETGRGGHRHGCCATVSANADARINASWHRTPGNARDVAIRSTSTPRTPLTPRTGTNYEPQGSRRIGCSSNATCVGAARGHERRDHATVTDAEKSAASGSDTRAPTIISAYEVLLFFAHLASGPLCLRAVLFGRCFFGTCPCEFALDGWAPRVPPPLPVACAGV